MGDALGVALGNVALEDALLDPVLLPFIGVFGHVLWARGAEEAASQASARSTSRVF